jgi:hypothetical protein
MQAVDENIPIVAFSTASTETQLFLLLIAIVSTCNLIGADLNPKNVWTKSKYFRSGDREYDTANT